MEIKLFFIQIIRRRLWLILALTWCLASCGHADRPINQQEAVRKDSGSALVVKDAIGFTIENHENYSVLHLLNHSHSPADTMSYILVRKGAKLSAVPDHYKRIDVPVQNIALLHTSYISFFDMCHTTGSIKAISERRYIYNAAVYKAVQEGRIVEVGYGETLDKEKLLELGTQVVITVGFPNVPNKNRDMLEAFGIPVLVLSDWQETNILGRMEWGKVVAALTGTSADFELAYDSIKASYNELKSMVKDVPDKPTIICNLPYKGSWYMPGGNSYVSNLLADAGVKYLWADNEETGGVQMDFEAIYAKGITADYWINPGFAKSYEDMLDKDTRLADFKPMQKNKVYNNNNRLARGEANDYWESGITHPHIVLADLIHILHPEVLPHHKLFYYRALKAHEDR